MKTTNPEKLLTVAVVVPVYMPFSQLSDNEMLALRQLCSVLYDRDIFLLYPKTIEVADYTRFFEPVTVHPILIDQKYFGTAKRINSLCISPDFYSRFSDYEYILMHHIDAYVFSDQLDYWCSQDLDYIGAPWFKKDKSSSKRNVVYTNEFLGAGNGGLSLRKVKSFLEVSQNKRFMFFHTKFNLAYHLIDSWKVRFLKNFPGISVLLKIIEHHTMHEDRFWGLTVPKYYKWFKVARPELAIKFSFEVMPEKLFTLNDNNLPFGCHAWEKCDREFWSLFIKPI